jgi:hypothetical protein
MDRDSRSYTAKLESKIDMLETELSYLDEMLVQCGFPRGIETLKGTVNDLLNEDSACGFEDS